MLFRSRLRGRVVGRGRRDTADDMEAPAGRPVGDRDDIILNDRAGRDRDRPRGRVGIDVDRPIAGRVERRGARVGIEREELNPLPVRGREARIGHRDGVGGPGNDLEDADGSPAEQEQASAEWRVKVAQAAQAAKMMGKLSANMQRFVDEVLQPKVAWQDVMRRFVEKVKTDLIKSSIYGLTLLDFSSLIFSKSCSVSLLGRNPPPNVYALKESPK